MTKILKALLLTIVFIALSCSKKETIPDPMISLNSFINDLEFAGAQKASKYFIVEPSIPWSEYPLSESGEVKDFDKWQQYFGGDELVEYLHYPSSMRSDDAKEKKRTGRINYPVFTQKQFIDQCNDWRYSNFNIVSKEFSQNNEKEFKVRGYVDMSYRKAIIVPPRKYFLKVVLRYGKRGWLFTSFFTYNENEKDLFGQ